VKFHCLAQKTLACVKAARAGVKEVFMDGKHIKAMEA
jgi:hypothetical protein